MIEPILQGEPAGNRYLVDRQTMIVYYAEKSYVGHISPLPNYPEPEIHKCLIIRYCETQADNIKKEKITNSEHVAESVHLNFYSRALGYSWNISKPKKVQQGT